MVDFRPVYLPACLALAIPSNWRSRIIGPLELSYATHDSQHQPAHSGVIACEREPLFNELHNNAALVQSLDGVEQIGDVACQAIHRISNVGNTPS